MDVLISRFAAQVEVGEDVVRGEGVLGIDILSEGWHEIPLELPQTAIG